MQTFPKINDTLSLSRFNIFTKYIVTDITGNYLKLKVLSHTPPKSEYCLKPIGEMISISWDSAKNNGLVIENDNDDWGTRSSDR